MSNWEHASEEELAAGREAYAPDDPKHPDYAGAVAEVAERKLEKESGAVETLNEALEHAQEPMRALNAALVAAQSEFPPIERSKTVTVKTREQGTYTFSYAPLDAILNATRPILNKHGLALSQQLTANGLRTELRHVAGARVGGSFPLPQTPSTPQQLGSLLTYLRRYTITALLGIAAEDDDDAGQARAEPSPFRRPDAGELLTERQQKAIYALHSKLVKAGAFDEETFDAQLADDYGATISGLTKAQASELIERLDKLKTERGL